MRFTYIKYINDVWEVHFIGQMHSPPPSHRDETAGAQDDKYAPYANRCTQLI